mmetsp:Transcript_10884/g.24725  ORF Transcript_10884/g.24725 Transcript_10884/m.24725 type:complete len:212 (-) Transcript_10884:2219-2854(-)
MFAAISLTALRPRLASTPRSRPLVRPETLPGTNSQASRKAGESRSSLQAYQTRNTERVTYAPASKPMPKVVVPLTLGPCSMSLGAKPSTMPNSTACSLKETHATQKIGGGATRNRNSCNGLVPFFALAAATATPLSNKHNVDAIIRSAPIKRNKTSRLLKISTRCCCEATLTKLKLNVKARSLDNGLVLFLAPSRLATGPMKPNAVPPPSK